MKFFKNIVAVTIVIILTSFYLFPFSFSALPGINTKMAMAACSLVILLVQCVKKREALINFSFIELSGMGLIVSIICLISVVVNNTGDYTYVSYIVSMWVWLGGAYTLISIIETFHGRVSIQILCDYFIAVCVIQCILAIMIDQLPVVKTFVNTYVGSFGFNKSVSANVYETKHRLYGIGAALDFAGSRFSAVLIMNAVIILQNSIKKSKELPIYIVSFILILIIGNMISRTTIVGAIIAVLYILFNIHRYSLFRLRKFAMWSLTLLLGTILIVVSLYNLSPIFKEYIEFGFEGFFNLAKKGEWQTNSGNILENMVRLPEDIKTWIIGDGYFNNPNSDIYYLGYQWKGFYMGTDIGYLRFIYYFGVVGLLSFIMFFFRVAKACCKNHSHYCSLFVMLLILNHVIWFKVSTDIFIIFAPFLCFVSNENSLSDTFDL